MAVQRPTLQKIMLSQELAKFYDKPIAQVSTGLVLSILAVLFFAIFAIQPTLETMTELNKQIEEKREVEKKLTLKISALTISQRELASKEKQLALLDIAVPATPRYSEVLFILEKVAGEHQVAMTTLSSPIAPLESTQSAAINPATLRLESIPFSASFTGSYTNLLSMVQEIESLQRIIAIDKMDISPSSDEKRTIINMVIQGRAFTFAPLQEEKRK